MAVALVTSLAWALPKAQLLRLAATAPSNEASWTDMAPDDHPGEPPKAGGQNDMFDRAGSRVFVAIPTHDRRGYVKLCADAMRGTSDPADVHIFDDLSTAFSVSELSGWFNVTADHVILNQGAPLMADGNAKRILETFLGLSAEANFHYLLTMDSDLIVEPTWRYRLLSALVQSPGSIVSIYHSASAVHKALSCDMGLCKMPSLGNAGTVWPRELAQAMVGELVGDDHNITDIDWQWSEWCKTNQVPLVALENSAAEHVGQWGQNTPVVKTEREIAFGFPVETLSPELQTKVKQYLEGANPDEECSTCSTKAGTSEQKGLPPGYLSWTKVEAPGDWVSMRPPPKEAKEAEDEAADAKVTKGAEKPAADRLKAKEGQGE